MFKEKSLRGFSALRIFVKILTCAFFAIAVSPIEATERQKWYWIQTDMLRMDPGDSAEAKTLVYEGAWMTLQHCTAEGWCFGEVYGHDEGWVPRRLLSPEPQGLREDTGLVSGLAGNESRNRRYHLQDRRKFYGLLSNTVSFGAANAETSTQTFSALTSWTFRAALGWHWGVRALHRWGSEVSFGHERISMSGGDGGENLSGAYLVGGLSIIRMAPYSHTWGFGWRARISFPVSRSFNESLEKTPSSLLFAIGPVWSHGVPASWPKPEWMEWEMMLKVGLSQWQLMLGSNFVF